MTDREEMMRIYAQRENRDQKMAEAMIAIEEIMKIVSREGLTETYEALGSAMAQMANAKYKHWNESV